MVQVLENLATAALTVFALVLSVIGLRAWHHTNSPKVMLLASGFLLFFVKGLVLSAGLFLFPAWEQLLLPSVVFDLAILAVFYVAILR